MAVEIDLLPVSGEKVFPDLRWIAGSASLALLSAAGWFKAVRR